MSTRIKHTGKAKSIPGGMAMAVSLSMVITFALSATIAVFLNREKISWEQAGYWIMGMLFISSFIGARCAVLLIKRQRVMVSVMLGVLYWGILLCLTALFFGGNFSAVLETAGIICAGSGVSALIFTPNNKHFSRKQGRAYS